MGIVDVVGQDRAGNLHFDRLGKGALRHAGAGAGVEREHRIKAGRSGVKQIGGAEIGLIMRQRNVGRSTVQPGVEKCRRVERQQHRHRTASDPVEDLRGGRIELHQRRRRTRIERG